jgi:DNA-binding response OmpR family regulator
MTRILVVDDHEDNVELLRARLEARGYQVEAARDGLEALERVHARAPDLILLDVMMPKLDGIGVVRRIKGNPDLPFIPIIMQTALDAIQDKVEGLDAGADDYITKPIDFAELEARVKSLLRIKGLQEELAKANESCCACRRPTGSPASTTGGTSRSGSPRRSGTRRGSTSRSRW